MSESSEVIREVEAAKKLLGEISFVNPTATNDLRRLENAITRISTMFVVQALDSVDFHRLDDELSEGKIVPRFVPAIKRAISMSDPNLFPASLTQLILSFRENLSELEGALIRNDLETARLASHKAHEMEHQLHHESGEWLHSNMEGNA